MEKIKVKISIIIATRDRRNYVLDLLSDIDNQDHQIFEVIVSDQSTNYKEIKNKYSFSLINFQNFNYGPCISRNQAVEKSSGDILIFLDDDARIERKFVSEIISPLIKGKSNASVGSIVDKYGDFKNITKSFKVPENSHFISEFSRNPSFEHNAYCNSAPAGCFAIFRNVFIKIGGYDNFFDPNGAGEDREFALRMMLNGYAIFYNCNAKLFHLEAGKGGRKSVSKYPTLFFKKNTAYTIYKHLGSFECKLFIMREIYFRMKLVVKFKMPRTQLRFIMKLYRSVDFKKFDQHIKAINTIKV